jgi:hypothetical protein
VIRFANRAMSDLIRKLMAAREATQPAPQVGQTAP